MNIMTKPPAALEKLVEVFKVIEYKDGFIYKTKSLGERWVPYDEPLYTVRKTDEGDIQYVNIGTQRLVALNYQTTRRKP